MTGPPVWQCRTCKALLSLDAEHFYWIRRLGRFDYVCSMCRRAANRARYEALMATPEGREYMRAANRQRHARFRKAHPGRDAERARAYRRRLDRERRAAQLQDARIRAKLGRDAGAAVAERTYATTAAYTSPARSHTAPLVPVEPLARWLRSEFPGWPYRTLADRLGVDERIVRRLIAGEQRRVSLHVADRIFVHADCPHLLALFYPEGS